MSKSYLLAAGVSPTWLAQKNAEGIDTGARNEKSKIEASIAKLREGIAQFNNLTVENIMLVPGDPASWEELVTVLKKHKYDAISFGGGVRTIPWLSDYFTELIQTATREQPQATLLFPLIPEDILAALKKFAPHIN